MDVVFLATPGNEIMVPALAARLDGLARASHVVLEEEGF